ncbi:hypothetical protein ACHAW5_011103 [Stephanodiscus triporus]|uniref:Uncharacterized protein n=1 Tax=Stephanodiscus triporus TaxID=2934178 RepID=A0ABD3P2I5_9STRA
METKADASEIKEDEAAKRVEPDETKGSTVVSFEGESTSNITQGIFQRSAFDLWQQPKKEEEMKPEPEATPEDAALRLLRMNLETPRRIPTPDRKHLMIPSPLSAALLPRRNGLILRHVEVDYDNNPTELFQALEARQFGESPIQQAMQDMGYARGQSSICFDSELPLHAALVFGAPDDLVLKILNAYPLLHVDGMSKDVAHSLGDGTQCQ